MYADEDATREQFTAMTKQVNNRQQANMARLAAGTTHRELTRHL